MPPLVSEDRFAKIEATLAVPAKNKEMEVPNVMKNLQPQALQQVIQQEHQQLSSSTTVTNVCQSSIPCSTQLPSPVSSYHTYVDGNGGAEDNEFSDLFLMEPVESKPLSLQHNALEYPISDLGDGKGGMFNLDKCMGKSTDNCYNFWPKDDFFSLLTGESFLHSSSFDLNRVAFSTESSRHLNPWQAPTPVPAPPALPPDKSPCHTPPSPPPVSITVGDKGKVVSSSPRPQSPESSPLLVSHDDCVWITDFDPDHAVKTSVQSSFQIQRSVTATQKKRTMCITLEDLHDYTHLPKIKAAKRLGVCERTLDKICRKNGLHRWPYCKIKAIDRAIAKLHQSLQVNGNVNKDCVMIEIDKLKIQRHATCRPSKEVAPQKQEDGHSEWPKEINTLNQSSRKPRMRVGRNLSFYECYPELRDLMKEIWDRKACIPSKEVATQKQEDGHSPPHDPGGVKFV